MGFIDRVKGVIDKMLGRQEITKPFGVVADINADMYTALNTWGLLFTKSKTSLPSIIAGEAARLATIDMQITVSGGKRAEYIQTVLDMNRDRLRSKLELGCAYGGMIIKPTLDGIDFIPATRYIPIEYDSNGNLIGVIFIDTFVKSNKYYNRLEYHHFVVNEDGTKIYVIENKAFKSDSKLVIGREIKLDSVPKWVGIKPFVPIDNVERPLFGYFRMPNANNIDVDSPLGVSVFSKAVETIKDFEMWYDKWKREGALSDKILFVDEQAMLKPGATGTSKATQVNPVPELIKGLRFGNNTNKCIEEFTPKLRVAAFRQALQTQLDLISVQSGFSSGYFSFDTKTGAVTATQIQSDDQRTNSTCTDIQQNYKQALEGLIYAMQVFYTLYDIVPTDEVVVSYYMKDLYVNTDEDRNRAFQLAEKKYIPKWKYLVDYEGYSEEDAKLMVAEAEGDSTVTE